MKTTSLLKLISLFLVILAHGARPAWADVSGSWALKSEGFWGQAMEATLTLKDDSGVLSGSYEGGFGKPEIKKGKNDGGAISFQFTQTFRDREITSKFSGKLDGGLLKGTITLEGMDEPQSAAWSAYRMPQIDPSGLWKWQTTSGRDGAKRDSWVKLGYDEKGLSGTYRTSRGQMAISDATLEGKEISFKVERRWGDRTFATAYKGTLGDTGITGKITSRRNDEDRVVDWAAGRETPKVDPLGTWSWKSRRGREGDEVESKFTIVKDGDALGGTLSARDGESPIQDVKLEGDVLSFKVTRDTDRGEFTSSFKGRIDEDLFDGKIGMKFDEREFTRSVAARRVLPKANPAGTWVWSSRRGRGGDSVENKLSVSVADGKLVGTFTSGDESSPIEKLAVEGNQISFEMQRTFRENPMTLTYSGEIRGDSIKGGYRIGEAGGDRSSAGWKSFWNAERNGK